uniref:Uncharacterized protein n=1 Tax=Oryza sativa subsp. japonica TaxID=39947 RepID=Q6YYD5_ORYSJ|nr:hypothetical protein [Oryza sativa Japonica Group]BAD16293.1 hypothetical protein [Oryza sativa Japonica Group]
MIFRVLRGGDSWRRRHTSALARDGFQFEAPVRRPAVGKGTRRAAAARRHCSSQQQLGHAAHRPLAAGAWGRRAAARQPGRARRAGGLAGGRGGAPAQQQPGN